MNDIVSINRQFLIMARQLANSKSESGEIVTGLPRPVLERLANLSLDQIEAIAERIGISLITIRLNEAELARLASLQDGQRAAYSLAVVAPGSR